MPGGSGLRPIEEASNGCHPGWSGSGSVGITSPTSFQADEPTGDLDSENAEEIVALMRRLNREQGLTFLIVTHDIGVGRSTDRIVRMVDGQIVDVELLEVR